VSNEVVEQPQPGKGSLAVINEYLDRKQGAIGEVLRRGNSGLSPRLLVRLAVQIVTKTPGLQKCHPATILNSLLVAASLGLDPTTTMGKFWLIPRWNGKMQCTECTPLIGYKGLCELALRSPTVTSINVQLAFEGEPFDIDTMSATRPIKHGVRFDIEKSEKTLRFAYAWATIRGSSAKIWECLSKEQVDARRARSAAKGFSPWQTDYLAMARKSALRALIQGGTVPTCEEMGVAATAEQAVEDEADMRVLPNLGVDQPDGLAEEPMGTAEVTGVEKTPVPENRSKEPIDPHAAAKALWLRACQEHSLPPEDAADLVRTTGGPDWQHFKLAEAPPAALAAAAQMLLKRLERP
jgi:recombination protein RecT